MRTSVAAALLLALVLPALADKAKDQAFILKRCHIEGGLIACRQPYFPPVCTDAKGNASWC